MGGFLQALYERQPDTLLISGGADGVDKLAETFWLERGGRVRSFRAREQDLQRCAIEVWDLSLEFGESRCVTLTSEPTFADRRSALFYRNALIAEHSDRVVAFFRRGRSAGTQATVDFATAYGRHVYEYEAAA